MLFLYVLCWPPLALVYPNPSSLAKFSHRSRQTRHKGLSIGNGYGSAGGGIRGEGIKGKGIRGRWEGEKRVKGGRREP